MVEHRSQSVDQKPKLERNDSIVKDIGSFVMHVVQSSVNLFPSFDTDAHSSEHEGNNEHEHHHEEQHRPEPTQHHHNPQPHEEQKDLVGSTDCFGSQLPDHNADSEVDREVEQIVS